MRTHTGVTADLAKLKDAEVTLIHIASDIPPNAAIQLPDDYLERTANEVVMQLGELAEGLGIPTADVSIVVRFGSVYREVLAQAKSDASNLIVIGCHTPDLADYLLGPNAARVVRHASCSVFVVR